MPRLCPFRNIHTTAAPLERLAFLISLLPLSETQPHRGLLADTFASTGGPGRGLARAWRSSIPPGHLGFMSAEVLVLQLHVRFFIWSPAGASHARLSPSHDISRICVKLGHPYGYLAERAIAACVVLYLTRDAPYTILVLEDRGSINLGAGDEDAGLEYLRRGNVSERPHEFLGAGRQTWEANGITPSGRCTGVSQFLALSALAIGHWERGWKSALDSLDGIVSVDVCVFTVISWGQTRNPAADAFVLTHRETVTRDDGQRKMGHVPL